MSRKAWIIGFCMLLMGCGHGQLSTLPKPDNSTNVAEVNIIRESRFLGGGLSYTIAMDNLDFLRLANGYYTKIKVSPGPHLFTVKVPSRMFGTKFVEKSIEIDCQPNTKNYILTGGTASGFELSVLSKAEGGKQIKEANYLEIKQ